MDRWNNCVAVVTGASSGIGEACARQLAEEGLRVVALARRKDRMIENFVQLSEAAQKKFFIRKCDISSQNDVLEAFEWIEKELGGVDILVNNAGILRHGKILNMDMDLIDETFNTNVRGLIDCMRAAYKNMKKRDVNGHIVHINSIVGKHVVCLGSKGPSFNAYAPSKFAVTAINEVVRQELNMLKTKIKTTSIHPGLVATEIMGEESLSSIGEAMLTPDNVAEAVLYVLGTPQNVLINELTIKPVGEIF